MQQNSPRLYHEVEEVAQESGVTVQELLKRLEERGIDDAVKEN